ncbi:ThiF family adenylyltransferase [[Eubacterium] cellulosolvens]
MKIRVKIPALQTLELDVPNKISVRQLKERACAAFNLEPQLTTLLYNNRILSDPDILNKKNFNSSTITIDYLWARQLILWGLNGQKTLRDSSVLIAGAGALGNETAKNLAMLGIGNITIVDFDYIEYSNLSRAVFFKESDIGQPKSRILAERLQQAFPYIDVLAYVARVESLPIKAYLESDLIISGLDNMISRIYLSTISSRYLIPLVDGGMVGYQCRIQSYQPPNSPCPLCTVPIKDYAELAGLRNPCSAPLQENTIPSLSTSISLVSSIQAQEAVKILLQSIKEPKEIERIGKPLSGTLIIDLKYNKFTHIQLKKNPECIVCGKRGAAPQALKRFKLPHSQIPDLLSSKSKLEKRLKLSCEEYDLFYASPEGFKKINKETLLKNTSLNTGDYISVICEGKDGEYKEVLIKIT